jgi:hypothetical protein
MFLRKILIFFLIFTPLTRNIRKLGHCPVHISPSLRDSTVYYIQVIFYLKKFKYILLNQNFICIPSIGTIKNTTAAI